MYMYVCACMCLRAYVSPVYNKNNTTNNKKQLNRSRIESLINGV